jgi:hypothetical protein
MERLRKTTKNLIADVNLRFERKIHVRSIITQAKLIGNVILFVDTYHRLAVTFCLRLHGRSLNRMGKLWRDMGKGEQKPWKEASQ